MEPDSVSTLAKAKAKISQAVVRYAEQTELRALITLIPFIGGPLDLIFGNEGQNIQQRRLLRTIEQLIAEMKKFDEGKLDKDYLKTEEFFDLIIKVLELSTKTRADEKSLLYVKILSGSVNVDNTQKRESAEDFLNMISILSPRDLIVAREIYRQQKGIPENFTGDDSELKFINRQGWRDITKNLGIDEVEFKLSLINLDKAGLIRPVIGSYYNFVGGSDFVITIVFQRLMSLIGNIL